MKATHATVSLKLVIPPGKTVAGMLISQLSFFASTGIVSLESMHTKERPATREEVDRNADFLQEWEMHLPEWEQLNAKPGGLAATERAANLARAMRVEAETDVTGAALPPVKGSEIFVIVDVTYDYYRFQDNLGAATDLEAARKIAAEYATDEGRPVPVIEDAAISKSMNEPETRHVWIERVSLSSGGAT